MILLISIITITICSYLLFATLTKNQFYSSALVTLFILDNKKWRLYRKAKKAGVKRYLTALHYEIDANSGNVPQFYLYPLVMEDGGIHYYLYGPNYQYITDNFQLISRV